jgi:quinol monooxygenase YgiN
MSLEYLNREENMIGVEILIKIKPGKRTEFLQVFDMVKTVNNPGDKRLYLDLFERVNDQNTFLWRENWQDTESLALYYADTQFKAMMGAIDILGTLVHKKTFLVEEDKRDE